MQCILVSVVVVVLVVMGVMCIFVVAAGVVALGADCAVGFGNIYWCWWCRSEPHGASLSVKFISFLLVFSGMAVQETKNTEAPPKAWAASRLPPLGLCFLFPA